MATGTFPFYQPKRSISLELLHCQACDRLSGCESAFCQGTFRLIGPCTRQIKPYPRLCTLSEPNLPLSTTIFI